MTAPRPRRAPAVLLALALGAAVAAAPTPAPLDPASDAPLLVASTQEEKDAVDSRLGASAHDLEESSEAVRAAAAVLADVERRLPGARDAAERAETELVAAREADVAAAERLSRAEAAQRAAGAALTRAEAAVEQGRRDVADFARAVYQRDRMDAFDVVFGASSPTDLLTRWASVRRVLAHDNEALVRLGDARADRAERSARTSALRDEVGALRAEAATALERSHRASTAAQAAREEVEQLAAAQADALAAAEAARADDEARYAALQAESARLEAQLAAEAAAARRAEEARLAEEARRAEEARKAEASRAAQRRGSSGSSGSGGAAAAAPAPAPAAPAPRAASSGSALQWPVGARLTSRFGYRTHPIYGTQRLHAGIDLGVGTGTPVVAARGGRVVVAGPSGGYGNFVVVDHGLVDGRGLATAYAHLSSIGVGRGQQVSAGQVIARSGNTGASTGPHLHFEVRVDGSPVDPLRYLP